VAQPPGPSDLKSKQYLEKLFAEQIEGHPLLVNNSRWASFRTRRTGRWSAGNVVLLGDAVHTAHFSVGSGTKMAMEDAIALSAAVVKHAGDLPAALQAYEAAARPSVDAIQDAARPSLGWWERFGGYHQAFEPWQFAYHFLSRSITDARLARRAPEFVRSSHARWRAVHGAEPLVSPLRLASVVLPARTVAVVASGGGRATARLGDVDIPLRGPDGAGVALRDSPGGSRWGLWLEAPGDEEGLPAARAEAAAGVAQRPELVAVHGGTAHTRTLLAEHVRLCHRVPSLVVDDGLDRDRAVTMVLSGRTDLVGGSPAAVASWTATP
jgi:anthraniloyl-CoA monooxygenase